jgi:hypothetical protein
MSAGQVMGFGRVTDTTSSHGLINATRKAQNNLHTSRRVTAHMAGVGEQLTRPEKVQASMSCSLLLAPFRLWTRVKECQLFQLPATREKTLVVVCVQKAGGLLQAAAATVVAAQRVPAGCARAAIAGWIMQNIDRKTHLITFMFTPCGRVDRPGFLPISKSSSLHTSTQLP